MYWHLTLPSEMIGWEGISGRTKISSSDRFIISSMCGTYPFGVDFMKSELCAVNKFMCSLSGYSSSVVVAILYIFWKCATIDGLTTSRLLTGVHRVVCKFLLRIFKNYIDFSFTSVFIVLSLWFCLCQTHLYTVRYWIKRAKFIIIFCLFVWLKNGQLCLCFEMVLLLFYHSCVLYLGHSRCWMSLNLFSVDYMCSSSSHKRIICMWFNTSSLLLNIF